MPGPPKFFFSHSRQDREAPGRYLRQFFEDLEGRVADYTAHLLDPKHPLGTIDDRIPHGDDWDATLSDALATDRVFVAVISPLYFERTNCGREFGVFILRSPTLGIDTEGKLVDVKNVLIIRWMEAEAYEKNKE